MRTGNITLRNIIFLAFHDEGIYFEGEKVKLKNYSRRDEFCKVLHLSRTLGLFYIQRNFCLLPVPSVGLRETFVTVKKS